MAPLATIKNLERALGKVLRIDVDGTNSAKGNYGIPETNPFIGLLGLNEIIAYGYRNPFNFSFDPLTGNLWLGDVGQNEVEEVNVVVAGGNYGWRIKEESFFFDPNGPGAGLLTTQPTQPPPRGLIDPITGYGHNEGLAAIGDLFTVGLICRRWQAAISSATGVRLAGLPDACFTGKPTPDSGNYGLAQRIAHSVCG